MSNNPLYDKEFLYKLDEQQTRTTYVRITALTKDELPLQQIEGRATGGSVSLDGSSSLRRTCSLTLAANIQDDPIDAYWSLRSKFKLEIGISNNTIYYPDYPIIWFKMGIYGINAFSKATSTSGITINISGQDKMCFMNGTLGGALTTSVNFGEEDFIDDNGDVILRKIPLKDIIQYGVHTYGGEPMNNIIIRDLDDIGYEMWDFRGGSEEYMFVIYEGEKIINITFNQNMKVYSTTFKDGKYLKDLTDTELYHRNRIGSSDGQFVSFISGGDSTTEKYKIAKISHGEAAGYKPTEMVYAGDLIVAAGQPFTEALNKIRDMLGQYEYFYDVDGRFIFQRKPASIKGLVNFDGSIPLTSLPDYSYKFLNDNLYVSVNENPVITDVRNDLTVWGSKLSVTGQELPVHARIALQNRPVEYTSPYQESQSGVYITYSSNNIDWRELIYQMAKDYFEHHDEYNFEKNIAEKNQEYYPTGRTGYEQYYSDFQAFWRQIYWKENLDINIPKDDGGNIIEDKLELFYFPGFKKENYLDTGWSKTKEYTPESLIFWFDLIEPNGLEHFSVETIGSRTKVNNSKGAKSIYTKEAPQIIFQVNGEEAEGNYEGTRINIGQEVADNVFSISTQGGTVLEELDDMFYKHVCLAEGLNINTIPIYHIEPNTLIQIKGEDYLVSKIILPLAYNGSMSITASKVLPIMI